MTSLSGHYELFGATHPGEANGPRQWANPKLFEAVGPSMSAGFTPLRSVLGFSEQARRWVKKFIQKSEEGLCKGLTVNVFHHVYTCNQGCNVQEMPFCAPLVRWCSIQYWPSFAVDRGTRTSKPNTAR